MIHIEHGFPELLMILGGVKMSVGDKMTYLEQKPQTVFDFVK